MPAPSDRPQWERDGADWPNRAASRFVEAAGLTLARPGDGRARTRPSLLLLHGTGAATHSWRGPRAAARRALPRRGPGPAGPRLHRSAARRPPVPARHGGGDPRPAARVSTSRPTSWSAIRPARRSWSGSASTALAPAPAGRPQRRADAVPRPRLGAVPEPRPDAVPQPDHPADLRLDRRPPGGGAPDPRHRLAPRRRGRSTSTGACSAAPATSPGRSA